MRRLLGFVVAVLLSLGTSRTAFAEQTPIEGSSASTDIGWTRLFDGKSLDGWYIFLSGQKRNEDPTKVFQVHDGVIHVYKDQAEGSNVAKGYLATESQYTDYHLRLEYKWGVKKFRPRTEQRRDAGLLYHVRPPDVVWPRCVECQIQENDVGDCFLVRGTRAVAGVEMIDVETPSGTKKLPIYKSEADGGASQTIGGGPNSRIVKSSTHERDGWNTIEVYVQGSKRAEHIVNGHTVFLAKDLSQSGSSPIPTPVGGSEAEKNKWVPLTHGRIALQAEYAEVSYRNIEIRPIPLAERNEVK